MATSLDSVLNLSSGNGNPDVHPVIVEGKLRRWYSTGNIINILDEAVSQSRFVVVDSGFMRKLIPARRSSDSHLYSVVDLCSLSLTSSGQVTFASHGFGWQASNDTSVSGSPDNIFGSDQDGLHMLVSPHQSEAAIQNGYRTLAAELQELAEGNRSFTMGNLHEVAGQLVTSASAPVTFMVDVDNASTDNEERSPNTEASIDEAANQLAALSFIDESDAE